MAHSSNDMRDIIAVNSLLNQGTINLNYTKPSVPFNGSFNVRDPVESFQGREDYLKKLDDAFNLNKKSTVLSNVKIISGLGGVGKTETARMYISKFGYLYENKIWINAENVTTLSKSFSDLAQNLGIELKDSEGQFKKIDQILNQVYQKLLTQKTLLIFDNAETYHEPPIPKWSREISKSIKNFVPPSANSPLISPDILVTSRNREWGDDLSENVYPLDVFSEDGRIQFIFKALSMAESGSDRDDALTLAKVLGRLPLALQQAVAYIRQGNRRRKFAITPRFAIKDYTVTFQEKRRDYINEEHYTEYKKTVMTTWNITLQKYEDTLAGIVAIEIIQILSLAS